MHGFVFSTGLVLSEHRLYLFLAYLTRNPCPQPSLSFIQIPSFSYHRLQFLQAGNIPLFYSWSVISGTINFISTSSDYYNAST